MIILCVICSLDIKIQLLCFIFKGKGESGHIVENQNFLVMAHNSGLDKNIHFYEVVDGIKDEDKCKPVRTGPSIAKNVGELNKRSLNYFNDHKILRKFPPTYYLKGDTTKEFVDKVDGLKWLANAPIKILTNYNPVDHLTLLGLSDKECNEIMSRTYERYDNVVLVVHPGKKLLMVNVVVDGVPDPKTLQLEMEKMNDILKTIYKTGYQKLKEHYMTLIGLIICPCLEEEDLNSKKFPFLNYPIPTFVTKNEWNNVELLEKKFKSLINESEDHFKDIGAVKSSNSTCDIEMYTGQLMASMAQRSLFLPKVTEDLKAKIDTILLNTDQICAIESPEKWKIITGGFGSGKTVVLNEIARQMIKQDDIGAICYLSFAPFSFIDKKIEKSLKSFCKEQQNENLDSKLKSISLQECLVEMKLVLSDVYDLTSPPKKNVALIMEHLKTKYCTDGKSMAILIDEFPREFIDKNYASRFEESLESHFKDITVAISFQSVEKLREFETRGKITNFRECSIEIPGMKPFKLGRTMRMSHHNYQLNKILKEEISRSKHVTPLDEEVQTINDSSNLVNIVKSREEIQILKVKLESLGDKNLDDSKMTKEPAVLEPTSKSGFFRLVDLELLTISSQKNNKVFRSINTKFSFIETKCGHKMCSTFKPKLYFSNSSLTSSESLLCLPLILKICIKENEDVVIICISKEQVAKIKMALQRIRLPCSIYTPYLDGKLPKSDEKSNIISDSNCSGSILLSDYRSFRGCEAEKCIMLIDLNKDIGANIYVEILTRSVAYLEILVTPRDETNTPSNTSKVMSEVLKKWKDFVSEFHFKLQSNLKGDNNQTDVEIALTDKSSGETKPLTGKLQFVEETPMGDDNDHADHNATLE